MNLQKGYTESEQACLSEGRPVDSNWDRLGGRWGFMGSPVIYSLLHSTQFAHLPRNWQEETTSGGGSMVMFVSDDQEDTGSTPVG